MITLNDNERIKFSAIVPDICKFVSTNDQRALDAIRSIIPIYSLFIKYRDNGTETYNNACRTFTYTNRKKKGKRRVYISIDGTTKLYISFISKSRVSKLCFGDTITEKWATDLIGNKWAVTSDSYKFQNIFQLLNRIIAIEKTSYKYNKPPTGNSDKWIPAESLVSVVSAYRSLKSNRHIYEAILDNFNVH